MNSRAASFAELSTLLSMCFLLLAAADKGHAQQVINTNGSFEATEPGVVEDLENGVEGWVLNVQAGVETAPEYAIVEDTVQEGERALSVTVRDAGDEAWGVETVADSLLVEPDGTYEYSVWARAKVTIHEDVLHRYLAARSEAH